VHAQTAEPTHGTPWLSSWPRHETARAALLAGILDISSIYAKLGTDDRSAAVRCARELRLLAAHRR
jgi:hypothetical protein